MIENKSTFHHCWKKLQTNIGLMETSAESHGTELMFYRTMFQNLIERAPIGIYILRDGSYSYVNSYYARMLGYTKEEFTQGKVTLEKTIHPEDYAMIQDKIEKRKRGEKTVGNYRVRKINKNGSILHTELQTFMEIISGNPILFGSVIDITAQVEAQQKLKEGNEQYKSLFENSPDAIYSVNEDGFFINANPASEQLTGFSLEELIGSPFMPLIASGNLPEAIKHFENAKAGIPSSSEMVLIRKDGQRIHIQTTHFPLKVNGKIAGTYGTARDITQKILYDEQMKELAFYDPLTGLPNRKLFEDRVEQLINLTKKDEHLFAIIFLDMDRFKFINDSFGHHIGDEFLKIVANRLKQTIRKTDTLSRLAGDEFTILVPDTSYEEVSRMAERINQVMSEPFHFEGHSLKISASIGVAFSTGRDFDVHELLRHADTAMYQTKKFKRSLYTIYSEEMDSRANYQLAIERDLPHAINNDEFELHYQPIIDLKSEQIIAMEALIRWHHPEIGLIPPNDFIRVAEKSGHINSIGAWVLQTACRQNKKWQNMGVAPFKIAVNISTKQLQQFDFVETIQEILVESGLEPKWLELEVTESILLDDVELIKESLLKLKDIGVSISIDDFGTGYTSLSYLRQYPFDKVKIDKSFIDDISRDLNGKRITSAIISLAHSLNMNVVAEGIEGETELIYLKQENCDGGQGYLFSKPMPVHSFRFETCKN